MNYCRFSNLIKKCFCFFLEQIKTKQEETETQLKEMDEGLSTAPLDDEDDEPEETFHNEPPRQSDSGTSEPEIAVKELHTSAGDDAIDTSAANGEGEGEEEQAKPDAEEQREEPPKPKDIHEELKELTAGYAEELNFEDDEQQRWRKDDYSIYKRRWHFLISFRQWSRFRRRNRSDGIGQGNEGKYGVYALFCQLDCIFDPFCYRRLTWINKLILCLSAFNVIYYRLGGFFFNLQLHFLVSI